MLLQWIMYLVLHNIALLQSTSYCTLFVMLFYCFLNSVARAAHYGKRNLYFMFAGLLPDFYIGDGLSIMRSASLIVIVYGQFLHCNPSLTSSFQFLLHDTCFLFYFILLLLLFFEL